MLCRLVSEHVKTECNHFPCLGFSILTLACLWFTINETRNYTLLPIAISVPLTLNEFPFSLLPTPHPLTDLSVAFMVASFPARAKNGGAPGTHCLRMRLISPRCGESGLFSDSSVLCDVRVRTRYSILVRII